MLILYKYSVNSGEESARLVTSSNRSLAMFSLGQSVPTPSNGIIADVVVFNDYKSLAENIANVTTQKLQIISPYVVHMIYDLFSIIKN